MKIYKHRVIRRASSNDFIFTGGTAVEADGTKTYDYIWSYSFDSSSWESGYPRMETGRIAHGVALINNEEDLIVAGGKEYTSKFYLTSTVEKFNFATRTWTYLNDIPGPNDYSFLVRNDGVFTAISSTPDTVYEYNAAADQWNQMNGAVSAGVKFDASLVDTEELYTKCG